jgi:tRNA G10  N-methylase Trm11|tara:strand:- start:2075 stop:3169 length:1095 start_codon:yes stop_codon:yes gene_type:complete
MYAFILGHNPKLSAAEILAVLPKAKLVIQADSFLILEDVKIDCQKLLRQLGGTIKIGEVLAEKIDQKIIVEKLKKVKASNKLKFGLSYYNCPKDKLGMEVKTELKEAGISCRLVTSRDKALSSVVVTKNKVHDFLILGNKFLAQTCAVQEFEEYSKRDYGRPVRDMQSGSMPPKLAKIMINLAQLKSSAIIIDPFCGSGTVLQEALLLNYNNIIGSDISAKAIQDTKNNLKWLVKNQELKNKIYTLHNVNVIQLSQVVTKVDAIVSEPLLGPTVRGTEKAEQIEKIVSELSELYTQAFAEFKKILTKNGKVVIVFPSFRVAGKIYELEIIDEIKKLGFSQLSDDKLIYSRQGQKVYRNIKVFRI